MKKPARYLTKKEIRRAEAPWSFTFGNNVLYTLCRDHPHHDRIDKIAAKVWLIGRSYAASVERYKSKKTEKTKTGRKKPFFTRVLAPHVRKSGLDAWLAGLPKAKAKARFADYQAQVVDIHGKLVKCLSKVIDKDARSFASKYLHFHRPDLFPLYDSRAAKTIKAITPDGRFLPVQKTKNADDLYAIFCARVARALDDVHKRHKTRLSLRQLDRLLIAEP